MNDAELISMLNDLESDRVERKASISEPDRIREAICAFANDLPDYRKPGILFIGATDHGDCANLPINDRLLLTLADMRSDGNILPLPSMIVQKHVLKGCEMAVVIVEPAAAPPVRFRGRTWIRVGPRRAIATLDEERRLNEKRRYNDIPFDVSPVSNAGLQVLDDIAFRRIYLPSAVAQDVLQQNDRTFEEQLLASKFAHPGPPVCPTNLGILSIGKDPTEWIPGAYIQFVRFEGTGLTDSIKTSREIRGALPDLMTELDEILKINIQEALDATSASKEIRKPDYPLVALQQISRNAILHRSYESTHAPVRLYWFADRVEIQNAGGPFGQVTRQNFGKSGAYDYRNPHLAAVMKELGYVQRFGAGIALSRKAAEDNGNPLPEFQVEDAFVNVILRRVL